MSVESYIQYNDKIQMRNYGRNKRGIPASYCVNAETPHFLFFRQEGHAGARTSASSNPTLKIRFADEGIGAAVSI